MDRIGTIRDPEGRRMWARRQYPRCQVCGRPDRLCDFRGLSVHHICRFRRSDEPTNFLLVCGVCHDAIHFVDHVGDDGEVLEQLTVPMQFAIKKLRAPEEYDEQRLLVLWARVSYDPEPVPEWVQEKWKSRRF